MNITFNFSDCDDQGVANARQIHDEINKHEVFQCRMYVGEPLPITGKRNISISITSSDEERCKVIIDTIRESIGSMKLTEGKA